MRFFEWFYTRLWTLIDWLIERRRQWELRCMVEDFTQQMRSATDEQWRKRD